MVPSVTAAQMAEVDRIAVERYGIKLHRMMNFAGMHTAEVAKAIMNGTGKRKVLVLAGKGNNGGDAIVAARYLALWGASCFILLPFAKEEGKPVIEKQLSLVTEQLKWHFLPDYQGKNISEVFSACDIIIDGLLGYSLTGNPAPAFADLIAKANGSGKKILAIDVPSGLDATTGEPKNPCITAYATLTLALPKTGLMKAASKQFTGTVYLADIGIPPFVYSGMGLAVGDMFSKAPILKL